MLNATSRFHLVIAVIDREISDWVRPG